MAQKWYAFRNIKHKDGSGLNARDEWHEVVSTEYAGELCG